MHTTVRMYEIVQKDETKLGHGLLVLTNDSDF